MNLDRLPFAPFDAADRFVVQEWIPGRDSDVYFCLTYRNHNGEELAAQGGRKITQWRVDTGSTALAVTHQDAELHELARRQMSGFGGMLSVELKGGYDAADRLLSSLRLFTRAASLGGVESLAVHPALAP